MRRVVYMQSQKIRRERENKKKNTFKLTSTVRMMIPESSIEKEGGGVEGGRCIPGFRLAKCSVIRSGFDHCE